MDKNKFYLIIAGGVVIILFLFIQFQNIKHKTISEYKETNRLENKIQQIVSLQKSYNQSPEKILNKLKFCKITSDTTYQILCENLNQTKFRTVSNLIFNSNLNILKFKIKKDNNLSTIYVEIPQ